ncbi:hypothetical protein BT93_E1723 [Corymbia citriodora subsp. variegata]|nr:hypothetical protein BT93_E1723 [Corymbia citriodora subsp. variegata]
MASCDASCRCRSAPYRETPTRPLPSVLFPLLVLRALTSGMETHAQSVRERRGRGCVGRAGESKRRNGPGPIRGKEKENMTKKEPRNSREILGAGVRRNLGVFNAYFGVWGYVLGIVRSRGHLIMAYLEIFWGKVYFGHFS